MHQARTGAQAFPTAHCAFRVVSPPLEIAHQAGFRLISKCKSNYAKTFLNKDNKNSFPRKRGREEVKAGMKVEDNAFQSKLINMEIKAAKQLALTHDFSVMDFPQ